MFANLLLADEINRAPAKVQSALLEVMQERQVTIAGETHKVPEPFVVMATQNPIETEGTYPLPEAQVDRFMMKVLVDYPSDEEEFVIVERVTGAPAVVQAVAATAPARRRCSRNAAQVYVDPSLIQYAVQAGRRHARARALRPGRPGQVPDLRRQPARHHRLVEGARALAFLRGRSYALPEDMTDLVPDVLRHRLVLSYEALADSLTPTQIVQRVMAKIAGARQAAGQHAVTTATRSMPEAGAARRAPRLDEQLLRQLEWTVIRRLDGLLQGDYRTLLRGAGLDLADLREYQYARRRAPHRLERHRAAADAACARSSPKTAR